MASIDVYLGFQWGVDGAVITEGDGLVQPKLTSVISTDPNTVRATFDLDMAFLEAPGSVLKAENWTITEDISGDPLPILYISKVSEKVVDIHTSNQDGVTYNVAVANVTSAEGTVIDPGFDTGSFSGTAEVYPTFVEMHGFFGLDSGMQGERIDVSAPYVDNEDPAPLSTGVAKDKIISFDLLDAEDQLDLTTVQIWIEGNLAYDGSSDTFYAPYNGVGTSRTPTTNGHTFTFERTSNWTSYDNVSTHVYAEDTAGFTLDVTWTFRVEDYEAPVIDSNSPTGAGAAKDALILFSIKEVGGSGVVMNSIQATVQGFSAIINGLFQVGFQGPSSSITPNGSNGYDVVIDREADHPSSGTVAVNTSAQDAEANVGTLNWSFSVEDHAGPLVTPLDPLANDTDIDVETDISFSLEDDSDVDLDTVVVEVDPGTGFETAFVYADTGNEFKSGWNGTNSSIGTLLGVTTIVIDKETPFDVGTIIRVRVTAKDTHGNPARLS